MVGVSQSTVRGDVQVSRDYSPATHPTVIADRRATAGKDLPPVPAVNPETGEVSDDNLSDAATGGEVTPPAGKPVAPGAGVEEPGEEVACLKSGRPATAQH